MTNDVPRCILVIRLLPAPTSQVPPSSGARLPWWRGWGPLVVLPAAVLALVRADWPRWALMWLLAVAIYAGCKWLTWRRTPAPAAPGGRHAGYLLGWPGMDAADFLGVTDERAEQIGIREWLFALSKTAFGFGALYGLARLVPADRPYLAGWIGMVGVAFILHFGTFHLLSCLWRSVGVAARPLMHWPVAGTSLADFWSRRWNTAFRDIAHRFLFRPLTSLLGPPAALLMGFAVSGVCHDLVISVPAGGGYGGPTAYFLIQGLALLGERSRTVKFVTSRSAFVAWLLTATVVLAPGPLLFHRPFVERVVVPFLSAIGAV